MSRRYSTSTTASRVAEGTSARPDIAIQAPIAEGTEAPSQHTFFHALSIRSGRTSRIARRLSSRLSEPSTFYREATPPGSSQGELAVQREDTYDGRYDYVAPPAPIPIATTCGLPRRKFCILLWAVIVAVIIAVAVLVGVVFGLRSRRHRSVADNPADATSSVSLITSASSTSAATPTGPSVASPSVISCPAANNTLYFVPDTTKTFRRLCGIDYIGIDQARDLGSVWTTTMQECIFRCANFSGCTACGWGIIDGDPGSEHRCWLKAGLQASHTVRPGWDFAILAQ